MLVDPPEVGQGPVLCRKSSGELVDGRIYVRNEGATDEATAAQIDQLLARGRRAATPSDPFDVAILGEAHPLADLSAVLEDYIKSHRDRLFAPLAPKPPVVPSPKSFVGGFSVLSEMNKEAIASIVSSMEEPEKRSEAQYRSQIDRWEKELRAAWPAVIDRLAGRLLAGVGIRISNRTKTFFQGVELAIHLEGDVRGIDHYELGERISSRDLDLPLPPRLWGPQPRRIGGLDHFNPVLNGAYSRAIPSLPSSYVSKLDWRNSGSVDLTLKVDDLRPLGAFEFDSDEIVLVLPEAWVGPVSGTWTVTAEGYHDVFEGSLVVQPDSPRHLDRALRGLLKLEDSDA